MELKLFFISYSVIYAKYNYCFEVPKDMPLKYFDGKEWKSMKPRNSHFKPRDSIISQTDTMKQTHTTIKTAPTNPFVLRLAQLLEEIKGIGPEASPARTQNEPTHDKTTEEITIETTPTEQTTTVATTTEKTTVITKPTPKTTTKPIPLKKITTKKPTIITKPILNTRTTTTKKAKFKRVATLIMTKKKIRGQFTNKIKSTNKFQRLSCCKSSWKRTTKAKKIEPRVLKTMTKKVCNKPLNLYWRPTYPNTPSRKLTHIHATKTTKKYSIKKTKKPTPKTTTEITTTEKDTITTTQTSETTKELPAATTKKPIENTGIQDEAGALPGDMSNLMREFLKFVEAKKCEFPCKPGIRATEPITAEPTTTEPTTMPFAMLLVPDNQSVMSDTDDVMNILMGIKMDDKLNEDDKNISQSKTQHQSHNILRMTAEKDLQNEITKHIKEDNDTLEFYKQRKFMKDLKAILYERSNNKTYHISGTETYPDELEGKNFRAKLDETKSYETIRVGGKKAFFDKFEDTNAKILDDSEIESFLNILKNKHDLKKKEFSKDNEAQLYLDAYNARYSKNIDRNEERNNINAIKDAYSRSVKDNLQNVPKALFHSNELYKILAYMTSKHRRFTEIKSQRNNEDNLEDREETRTTSNLEVIESKNVNAERMKVDQIPRSYKYTTITNFQNGLHDL